MKVLFYIVAAIFLFFTAPIWVPALGILGLVTGIGAGTAIIAANHASSAAPAAVARPSPSPPTYVAATPAVTTPPLTAILSPPPTAQPVVVCAWVYDRQACHTVAEWAEKTREWCDRAAQSTARRQAMQAKGWGTNRFFMSPYSAEFVREGRAEAVAGTICSAEKVGLASAEAETTKSMER